MSRGRKKPSLFDLSREPLQQEDLPALAEELLNGNDRSAALIGCAMIETALLSAITSRFISMEESEYEALFFSPTAPLSNFSSRIKLGRAIAIYGSQLHTVLDTIRRVRNTFAHSVRPLKFSHELIEAEVLSLRALTLAHLRLEGLAKNCPPLRERYVTNCLTIALILERNAAKHAGEKIFIDIHDGDPTGPVPSPDTISVQHPLASHTQGGSEQAPEPPREASRE